jgi:phenylpropionate dioxygenase-like ring-hydroxylating dioxygenase large terminal subunit
MLRSDQQKLKDDVDRHLANGTTTMAKQEWLNPVAEYVDADHLGLEIANVLRRLPVIVAHTSELRGAGDFVTRNILDVPLLIVRGDDATVRAFVNVCRHRGSAVVSESHGCARRFTCPYHAWSYSSDGTLVGIPNDDGFENIDRSLYGLVELPCEDRHGFVWASLTADATFDAAEFLGDLDEELGSWGLDRSILVKSTRVVVDANWKLLIDGFLETYHVRFLHSVSVAPYIHSNLGVFNEYGRHGRMANVRTRYEGANRPLDDDFLYGVGGVYVLFPNTVILWHGTHHERYTFTPHPGNPGRTDCDIELLAPAGSQDLTDKWERNWELVISTITGEDFPMAISSQAGFAAGYPDHFVFGRNEPFVQHFHRQLKAELASVHIVEP